MRKSQLFGLLITALLISACGAAVSGTQGTSPAGGPEVLLQDDFSNPGSGWDRRTFDEGLTDYADGGYRIFVNEANYSAWANPNKTSYTDVRVEVDAHKIGGVDDNEIGLVCRHSDPSNFYYATISSDGFYGFWKLVNGELGNAGGTDGLQPSDAIVLGEGNNHLRLDCIGSTLTLYVNGETVASITDSSLANGDVGVYAGTWDTAGTDILFDNFVLYQP